MSKHIQTYKHLLVLLFAFLIGMGTGIAQTNKIREIVPVLPPHGSDNDEPAGSQTIVTQAIALALGANWVSTYVDITLDDLKAALLATLPSAAANSIVIKSKDNGSTTYRGSGSWRGNLNALDLSQSYRITVGSDCVIMLEGMPIDPASLDININNGVNWIPFPFDANMTVANAFAGFAYNNDQVKTKINSSSTTYKGSTSSWRGSLSTLIPGQGYVYKSAKSEIRTFHFPTSK